MSIEEMEREHEKSLLALEQEIEGWKSANRILKAKLEIAETALEQNQRLVKALEQITEREYYDEKYPMKVASEALQAYKLLEKKD